MALLKNNFRSRFRTSFCHPERREAFQLAENERFSAALIMTLEGMEVLQELLEDYNSPRQMVVPQGGKPKESGVAPSLYDHLWHETWGDLQSLGPMGKWQRFVAQALYQLYRLNWPGRGMCCSL